MDIFEFFDEYDIQYFTEGKNVTLGWTNIRCLFCDDESNHLGIKLSNLRVKCWRCGEHKLLELISEVAQCSISEAKATQKILLAERTVEPPILEKEASSAKRKAILLPTESTAHFPKMHIEYLEGRGFNPRQIIRRYKLRACYTVGRYKFRIIIPIYLHNRLVSFTSRDITDEQSPPYKNASAHEVIVSPKRTVYNYDNIQQGGNAILVEGPIDVWKLGKPAISILGVEHTEDQILYLMRKKIDTLFILFDNDGPGRKAARKLGRVMASIINNVELIFLKDTNDPGALTLSEAELLKQRLGFK